MSIDVQGLTKTYGEQQAVKQISFSANKGEVLGFLGPNGAGKTTTMKMLTCFIPPTSGVATVCGFDTVRESIAVRQRIGYLPEHNPLYKEMYVKEYLFFVAGLHRVAKPKQRVAEMIEMTGLTKEQHKPIGALSKGYRQRVGLAQAMIHDPEVLILDEPTSGLDPNQLIDIRQLILSLGKEKTVIFSTHIMQEVQELCSRVIIINRGEIVANDAISSLQSQVKGETLVTISFAETVPPEVLKNIKGVSSVTVLDGQTFRLHSPADRDVRAEAFRFAVEKGLTLLEMHREVSSIENIFQTLTRTDNPSLQTPSTSVAS